MHLSTVLLGVVLGLDIGLLAVGLVLIYRTTRILNFAHGELGAVSAVLLSKLVVEYGLPYWPALAFVLVLAALLGGGCELLLRRLFDRPRVLVMVATIGLSQVLFLCTLLPQVAPKQHFLPYPVPIGWHRTIGAYIFQPGDLLTLVVAPVVVLALALFLARSPHGLAMRAMAENGEAARLSGVWVRRTSTIAWMIAAVLSAVTVILSAPGKGSAFTEILPLDLLVRALAAALIGAMTSLPIAFGAGIAIGVVQLVVTENYRFASNIEVAIFAILLVALVVRAGRLKLGTRDEERSSWRFSGDSHVGGTDALRRLVSRAAVVLAAVVVALLPLVISNGRAFLFGRIYVFAVIALSLTILTGWAGQLSLGQFSLVAVGAIVATRLGGSMPLPLLVPIAGVAGALVAVVIGLPALRIRGLYLAVSTLGFAVLMQVSIVATPCWRLPLVGTTLCTGLPDPASTLIERPTVFGFDLSSDRSFYYVCLAALVLSLIAARSWRDHGIARSLIAVRDNEVAAAAMGIRVIRVKLLAFALSGFMAGSAGVLFAYLTERFKAETFGAPTSILIVSMAIVGGLGSVPGAVLGAVYLIGLPAAFGSSQTVQFLTSGIGLLVVLLYLPGGLAEVMRRVGDGVCTLLRSGRAPGAAAPARVEP